ncbi:hypothetical protein HUB97_04670 [Halorubraceae archaeon YAN]|nr:hypothetical protein [Halorubraceae archaeon YAN]
MSERESAGKQPEPESIDLQELSIKERIVIATFQRPAVGLLLIILLLIAFTFFIAFLMYIAYFVL